jgi:hypothetical protein
VASAALRRTARPAGLPVWWAAAVLVPAAGVLSGLVSSLPASLLEAVQLTVLCALAPAVFRYDILRTRGFLTWVVAAFLGSQTLSAAVGLYLFAGTAGTLRAALFGRAKGLAGHPNTLGIMCVIALLVALSSLGGASPRVRAGLWAVITLNAMALVATGSLSAMLAGVLGAAVLAVGRRRVALALAVSGVALLAGTVLALGGSSIAGFLAHRVAAVFGAGISTDRASLAVRLRTYRWAFAHIAQDPLRGVGMDGLNSGTYDGDTVVHNALLRAWYQGGFLLFAWFLAVTVVLLVLTLRAMTSRQGVGAAAVIAASGAYAATSAAFVKPQYWLPLLFAVALLPAAAGSGDGPPGTRPRRAGRAGSAAGSAGPGGR